MKNVILTTILLMASTATFNSNAVEVTACSEADCVEYFKQYKIYAKRGYADAMTTLGDLYANGHGTDKNVKKALKQYRRAAKYGSVEAQYKAASLYLLEEDYYDIKSAIKYLKMAARNKAAEASLILSIIYFNEKHYEQDLGEVDKWLSMAYKLKPAIAIEFTVQVVASNLYSPTALPLLAKALERTPLAQVHSKLARQQTNKTDAVMADSRDHNSPQHGATSMTIKANSSSSATAPRRAARVSPPAPDGEMEVISVTSRLHDLFQAQLDHLNNTYPEQHAVTTGTKIAGRTCEETFKCAEMDKLVFEEIVGKMN